MTPEVARQTREQMLRDGFCVVPDVLTDAFVAELKEETARLNATEAHHPDTKYQGTHLGIKYADNPIMRRLAEWQPARRALEALGFGDFAAGEGLLVLTKPARGPALYWHQDWMQWNDPLSCTPWPQIMFVSYYLEGTSIENGCLKIIPGTHLKRIPLHDELVTAHEQGARFIEEDHPIMFSDHPDQVNVEVGPRDLVLADARVLHAAYKKPDRRAARPAVAVAPAPAAHGARLLGRRYPPRHRRTRPRRRVRGHPHSRQVPHRLAARGGTRLDSRCGRERRPRCSKGNRRTGTLASQPG